MRGNVLRAFHGVFERDTALVAWCKHKVGARTHPEARVFGFDTRIKELALPSVVIGFQSGTPSFTADQLLEWDVYADIVAQDIWSAADGLDHLERIAAQYRSNTVPSGLRLNQIICVGHDLIEADEERVIQVRVSMRVKWTRS